MKILFIILLLATIIYNFYKRSQNIYKATVQNIASISSVIVFILGFFIWYYKDQTISGFVLLLCFTLVGPSVFLAQGISSKGINIFEQKLPIVRQVAFNRINDIRISEDDKYLKINVNAFGDSASQYYDKRLSPEITKFLENKTKIIYY